MREAKGKKMAICKHSFVEQYLHLDMKVNTQHTGPKGRGVGEGSFFFFLGTFLGPGGSFKELNGQLLDGEHGGVSLLLPLLILPP